MRLKVLAPVVQNDNERLEEEKYIRTLVRSDTEIDLCCVPHGVPSIESAMSHAVNAGEVVLELLRQDLSGYDGVFIDCFDDPGVLACREMLDIPVFGGYVPAMLTAKSLGERIGVITTDHSGVANEERKARAHGFERSLVAVSCVDIPVLELLHNQDVLLAKLADECERLYREYRANAACLGCTMMSRAWQPLRDELKRRACPIYVVEPLNTGLSWLENMVRLQYTNSFQLSLQLNNYR